MEPMGSVQRVRGFRLRLPLSAEARSLNHKPKLQPSDRNPHRWKALDPKPKTLNYPSSSILNPKPQNPSKRYKHWLRDRVWLGP